MQTISKHACILMFLNGLYLAQPNAPFHLRYENEMVNLLFTCYKYLACFVLYCVYLYILIHNEVF